ncbi:MAG TPA: histidinol-phosphate transaminase [Acidimicrobiales bacterium]|nr:histidinol-phosphate transaminase [Acidimicrobiales bacterium]
MTPPATRQARPLPAPRNDLGLREGYHSPQVPVEVRLNTNESPYAPPRRWLDAVCDLARDIAFNRYPDRSAWALREALAQWHGVRPEQVFPANGSNEVLQTLCLAYGGPGRKALMFEPTYALHSHIAHLTSTAIVQSRRRNDFSLDPEAAVSAVQKANPSIVFLCSPNNPTGLAEDEGTVSAVVGASPGLVVVDEAYGQFASWSALGLVDDAVPLAVVRTYSKTWSMAGLRLGYLVGPAEVVRTLERVALPYHLDSLKQAAGRLALDYSEQMERRVAAIISERERLISQLSQLPLTVWPSQANFVLWRPLERDGREVWKGLVDRSVLVRDTSSWPGLEGCLRTTVGTPSENDRFLRALSEVLA